MNLKTTLTILAGFVCAVMTTSAYSSAVTLGENVAADEQSVTVGNDAKGGYYAVSIGQGATTEKANFGVAIGTESIARYAGPQGQGSVAVGTRATAEHGGLALGYGATAVHGGIALGAGSVTSNSDEVNIGERYISGVKEGISKTDAVNLGQAKALNASTLRAANARTDSLIAQEHVALTDETVARRDGDAATLKSANDYTNWRVDNLTFDTADTLRQSQTYTDTRVSESLNYTDNKFSQLNTRIERAEKRLHAGIAGVAAIASIPYMASNRFSYGVAVGNYQNANALAGGIQYKTSPNTTIRLNVSLDSSHNAALAVGVGGGW
ncbi:YadA-like family protein [Serratia symbiotica]|uniref:YadA-like family protein n=1 Tax=Serratia symbiotica TaxID=138074 RepID=UPI001CF08A18|nr:YadA-like family protein [Serratia symbiotica]